jgi:hypothetical protein
LEHRGQIQVQEVSDDELHVRRELWSERGSEVAIDFDRGQMRDPGGQPARQRPRTGTNLQEPVAGLRSNRVHELVGPRRFEEMLAKPLPRANHWGLRLFIANIANIAKIANMLGLTRRYSG